MSDTPALPKRYFISVDGFRLIASMSIVLFHLQAIGGLWDLRERPDWLFRIIKGPAFHASVFFLLGGFIFTIKFADKVASFATWPFLKKRFSELYPLHLITTLLMAGLFYIRMSAAGSLDIPKFLLSIFMHLSLLWSFIPFGTYSLNRPSWALSAFFGCYLLFGIALRSVMKIGSKVHCVIIAICCMTPIVLWTILYGAIGLPAPWYHFFHTFAPIRFFEFLIGMLLARFFLLSENSVPATRNRGLLNDAMIAAAVIIVFFLLVTADKSNGFQIYFNYHVTMVPLYVVVLYGLATERGIIPWILALPFIRKTGRSSFYPYLIHIPLISIMTYIMEQYFSYKVFLHRPLNVIAFMLALYGGAYLYVNHVRRRKPSGPRTGSTVAVPQKGGT